MSVFGFLLTENWKCRRDTWSQLVVLIVSVVCFDYIFVWLFIWFVFLLVWLIDLNVCLIVCLIDLHFCLVVGLVCIFDWLFVWCAFLFSCWFGLHFWLVVCLVCIFVCLFVCLVCIFVWLLVWFAFLFGWLFGLYFCLVDCLVCIFVCLFVCLIFIFTWLFVWFVTISFVSVFVTICVYVVCVRTTICVCVSPSCEYPFRLCECLRVCGCATSMLGRFPRPWSMCVKIESSLFPCSLFCLLIVLQKTFLYYVIPSLTHACHCVSLFTSPHVYMCFYVLLSSKFSKNSNENYYNHCFIACKLIFTRL